MTVLSRLRSAFALFRFPGALVAVAGAALILGAAAAAGPLFLSSAGTAALRQQIEQTSPEFAGLEATDQGPIATDRVVYRTDLLSRSARGIVGIGRPIVTIVDTGDCCDVWLAGHPGRTHQVQVGTKTGFESHIERLGGGGGGWWVDSTTARDLGLRPGDRLVVQAGAHYRATVRVAGVYRDLHSVVLGSYWAPFDQYLWDRNGNSLPPFLLGDERPMLRLLSPVADAGSFAWSLPFSGAGGSYQAASRAAAELARLNARFADPQSSLGSGFTANSVGLPTLMAAANRTRVALAGPASTVSLAAAIIALGVVGVAGALGVRRRRTEYALLRSRGVSPVRLGLRAALEAVLPVAAGLALGVALSAWLMSRLGPARGVGAAALVDAARWAGVAGLAGLAVLGGVVASAALTGEPGRARARAPGGAGHRVRRVAAKLPWELVVLALAGAALYEILSRARPAVQAGAEQGPGSLDRLVLLFPILFVAGLSGLIVRLVRRYLPRVRRGRSGRPGVYLAVRRLAAAPGPAAALVTAAAVAIGILAYGGVLAASARAGMSQAALVAIGSDVSMDLGGPATVPPDLRGDSTVVGLAAGAQVTGGSTVSLLVVDPGTFGRGAYWNADFASLPLPELMRAIDRPGGGPVPVIVAGGSIPAHASVTVGGYRVPVRQVASAKAIPGMQPGVPILVAAAGPADRALGALGVGLQDTGAQYQLWSRGGAAAVEARARAAGISVAPVTAFGASSGGVATAAAQERTPAFQVVSWTLGFLEALGAMAGAAALVTMVMYLQARQRAREVSYALSRRMGLSRGSSRLSSTLELGGMLGTAFVLGWGLSIVAALLVFKRLDMMPGLPPGPVLAIPADLVGVVAAALAVCSWAGAWVVQRRADRANVAEVMRLAN